MWGFESLHPNRLRALRDQGPVKKGKTLPYVGVGVIIYFLSISLLGLKMFTIGITMLPLERAIGTPHPLLTIGKVSAWDVIFNLTIWATDVHRVSNNIKIGRLLPHAAIATNGAITAGQMLPWPSGRYWVSTIMRQRRHEKQPSQSLGRPQ